MKVLGKVLRFVFIIAIIIGIIYIALHLSEIIALLPLDQLKTFFGNMINFIMRVFGNIIDWVKGIFS